MSNQKTESVIPAPAQLVLDFFDNELSSVQFPDMNQAVLQEAAERVWILAAEQARKEAELQAAREALQEGQEQLLSRCSRALAYARVYAEDDPDLSRRLEAVNIPRVRGRAQQPVPADSGEAKPAGKRGRKPTPVSSDSGALFVDASERDRPSERNGVNGQAAA